MRRIDWPVIAGRLIALGVLAAIGYGVYLFFFATSDPEASDTPLREIDDLNKVCHPRYPEFFPKAAPYKPSGPRPVVAFTDAGANLATPVHFVSSKSGKDNPWRLAEDDPRRVQIVACVDSPSDGRQVGTCHFDEPEPETFDLYRGVHDVTVRETRTGKPIAEFTLHGQDDGGCPSITWDPGKGSPEFHTALDEDNLRTALERYVE